MRLYGLGLWSPVVLGLPRGGIPVAAQVAAGFSVPFEAFVARKVGAPGHEELGIGAVAEGLDEVVILRSAASRSTSPPALEEGVQRAQAEVARRVAAYRAGRPLPEMRDRDVVLVDDGLATGVTAEAALRSLRARHPGRLVLAAPVCAAETAARLSRLADDVVCVWQPADFAAVGEWYDDFSQTTDEEVLRLLDQQA